MSNVSELCQDLQDTLAPGFTSQGIRVQFVESNKGIPFTEYRRTGGIAGVQVMQSGQKYQVSIARNLEALMSMGDSHLNKLPRVLSKAIDSLQTQPDNSVWSQSKGIVTPADRKDDRQAASELVKSPKIEFSKITLRDTSLSTCMQLMQYVVKQANRGDVHAKGYLKFIKQHSPNIIAIPEYIYNGGLGNRMEDYKIQNVSSPVVTQVRGSFANTMNQNPKDASTMYLVRTQDFRKFCTGEKIQLLKSRYNDSDSFMTIIETINNDQTRSGVFGQHTIFSSQTMKADDYERIVNMIQLQSELGGASSTKFINLVDRNKSNTVIMSINTFNFFRNGLSALKPADYAVAGFGGVETGSKVSDRAKLIVAIPFDKFEALANKCGLKVQLDATKARLDPKFKPKPMSISDRSKIIEEGVVQVRQTADRYIVTAINGEPIKNL